jgi:ABC-2 type transport system permease protein
MTTPTGTVPATMMLPGDRLAVQRPALPTAGVATLAFAWRTLLKIKHVPEQLIDVIALPVVFTLMFTYLFGGALAGSTGEYLQSLLPGTLVMTVLLLTTFTGAGLTTDIASGVFDRFRSLPVWRPAPLFGALIGDLGRYLLASALVLSLGLVLGFRPGAGATGVFAAMALSLGFAYGVSWIWVVIGLLARTPTAVTATSFVVLFPLTLASNIFVVPETLPNWLRTFVEVNPLSHVVTATRGLMHGSASVGQVGGVVVLSAVLVAVFAPTALRLYRTRL